MDENVCCRSQNENLASNHHGELLLSIVEGGVHPLGKNVVTLPPLVHCNQGGVLEQALNGELYTIVMTTLPCRLRLSH